MRALAPHRNRRRHRCRAAAFRPMQQQAAREVTLLDDQQEALVA